MSRGLPRQDRCTGGEGAHAIGSGEKGQSPVSGGSSPRPEGADRGAEPPRTCADACAIRVRSSLALNGRACACPNPEALGRPDRDEDWPEICRRQFGGHTAGPAGEASSEATNPEALGRPHRDEDRPEKPRRGFAGRTAGPAREASRQTTARGKAPAGRLDLSKEHLRTTEELERIGQLRLPGI